MNKSLPSGIAAKAISLLLGIFVFSMTFSIAATQTALAAGLFLWVILIFAGKIEKPVRTALDLPIALFVAATLLAVLFSGNMAAAAVNLKNYLLLSIIYYIGFAPLSRGTIRRFFPVLVVSASGSALYGIAIFLAGRGGGALGRTSGPFSVAMTFGGIMMLLCSLFGAVGAGKRVPARIKIVSLAAAALTGGALFLSFTRSSWLGMVTASIVILLLTRKKLIVPFIASLVVIFFLLPPKYRERVTSIWDPNFRTNIQRIELFKGGISIWRENPIFGVGPVDLADIYRKHMPRGAVVVHGHMHNIFLHVAVTLGSVGLIAFSYLLFSFFRLVGGLLRLDLPPPERAWVVGSLAALAGFIVNGFFEWNFGDAEVVTIIYVIIGSNLALLRQYLVVAPDGKGSEAAA